MSHHQAILHARAEPSPPASPETNLSSLTSTGKALRLPSQMPASPPLSHLSTQTEAPAPSLPQDSYTPPSAPTMTTPDLDSTPAECRHELGKYEAEILRTSTKHRLPDEDVILEPSKRRRTDHDRDYQFQQSDLTEHEAAEADFGPLYKLSNQPLPLSRPHPSQDLISLYNLDLLAASVARKDPATGEKINPLRKSYKGKVKDFPGKNEAINKENQMFDLLLYPDEEWNVQRVQGSELERALSSDGQSLSDEFMRKLDSALDMTPGPLPRSEMDRWRSVIDLDINIPKAKVSEASQQNVPVITGASSTDESRRPKRKIAARNYHDESFEGYKEGFGEDLGEESMDGDDDRRSSISATGSKKKRRRDESSSHCGHALPAFSPGAVSVGGHLR